MDVLLCVVVLLAAVFLYLRLRRSPLEHDLSGKVVLLTGAGGGLGRHLALSLVGRGCRLACVDVAPKPNEETVAMVLGQGRPHSPKPLAKAYTADLTDRAQISALVENVIKDFGQVDILVNNAGQLQGGALWELSDKQLDLLLDVNLRACMLLAKDVLPHMMERRSGHIVQISSIAAVIPSSQMVGYSASKAGSSQFMECLHFDLWKEGLSDDIHVTTIQPFFINTFDALKSAIKYTGPLGRLLLNFLDVKDTANHIVWSIASRQSVVNIPGHMGALAAVIRLLPRTVQIFISERLGQPATKTAFPYSARHAALDADLMFELLSKGYGLPEDPAAVCAGLRAQHKDKALPYDFTPLGAPVREYYASRRQAVPEDVKIVFGL